MPSGYTSVVEDGTVTDLRTFALRCAKGFGACIMQRDDPLDVQPKPPEPSPYYEEKLAQARERLKTLLAMTSNERRDQFTSAVEEIRKSKADERAKNAIVRARYDAMIAKVEAWNPPTWNHEDLKKYMLQQLAESRKHDANDYDMPEPTSPATWHAEQIAGAERDIAYYIKEAKAEVERCAFAGNWIKALYDSLPLAPAKKGGA